MCLRQRRAFCSCSLPSVRKCYFKPVHDPKPPAQQVTSGLHELEKCRQGQTMPARPHWHAATQLRLSVSNSATPAVACSGWKKRQGRTLSSVSPTEGIACPHGHLLPASLGPKAKRAAVPVPLWSYFKERWQAAQQQQQDHQQATSPAQETAK